MVVGRIAHLIFPLILNILYSCVCIVAANLKTHKTYSRSSSAETRDRRRKKGIEKGTDSDRGRQAEHGVFSDGGVDLKASVKYLIHV